MKDSKPIIFDDELREAFERPLKKYPKLQKVLLTDSENENEEDAFISKIIIPLCSVMYYLINKDAAVFEYFVKFIDDLGELKSIPRLDSNEIFETLSQLSIRNALLVLERNNFTDGTYTELKESLEEGDKRRFVTTLKDCNTTPISPILKFLNIPHLVNQKFAALELEATKADFESNELFSKWALYKVRKLLQELFGNRIKTNGPNTIRLELPEGVEAIMQFEEEEDECVDTELVLFFYDLFFGLFSCINGEGVLDENEINVIEYILKQYPFEKWYEQHQDYWKNGGTDGEFLSFITRHKDYFSNELVNEINSSFKDNDSFEEAEVIEEPQSTLQIEEPIAEKTKDTPIPGKSDFIEQEPTKEEGHLYPNSRYGFIPEDYFSQKIDKAHPLDHYNLVKEIQEKGEEMFFDFITYLVDEQYIENDDKQKALFAYRLTGRLRPKDDDLPTVWWSGKNNSPKELLYIIRYCVDFGSKKKFSKQMKDFFEGPVWPAKNYSTIADWADTPFREALHDMYEVCGLKYNKPKKKKK